MIHAKDFRYWHRELSKARGRRITGSELAAELGRSPEYISRLRHQGCPSATEKMTRLAMQALLKGDDPWRLT